MKLISSILAVFISSISLGSTKMVTHDHKKDLQKPLNEIEINSALDLLKSLEKDKRSQITGERRGQICEGDDFCGRN